MLMRKDSCLFRALLVLWSPVEWLPPLFPMWVEQARVGADYKTYVNVSFRKPRKPAYHPGFVRRIFRKL